MALALWTARSAIPLDRDVTVHVSVPNRSKRTFGSVQRCTRTGKFTLAAAHGSLTFTGYSSTIGVVKEGFLVFMREVVCDPCS